MQFIGWVAPPCIRTDAVLNNIDSKLQCSVFDMKRTMNRVPACARTLILYSKWRLGIVYLFSYMVILRKGDSAKASALFRIFLQPAKLVIYTFIGHKLTSIYILYAWMILTLLMLYVIAYYVRSNM